MRESEREREGAGLTAGRNTVRGRGYPRGRSLSSAAGLASLLVFRALQVST